MSEILNLQKLALEEESFDNDHSLGWTIGCTGKCNLPL